MSLHLRIALLVVLVTFAGSCANVAGSSDPVVGQQRLALGSVPAVRFSEVHYDNVGTDTGEALEISGPAGMDVTGWQIVLYNGNGGASYNTQTLSGAIPATCGTRGTIVLSYPTNGLQNGGTTATGTIDSDGMALVDAGGAVVEFLSYEGTFAATNGPALGLTSIDIGPRELGNEVAGQSLQRNGVGAWSGPLANTFGACNDADEPPPPAEVTSIAISPATATIASGATQAFVATAFDAANLSVAGVAFTWTSSAGSIASVAASGVATGVAEGDAAITATAPNGIAASAMLHVNSAPPPPPPGMPDTRFSELHYDNLGTDVAEAIEVEGPAGTDLTGWSIVLYDGNGGALYNTQILSGSIPATCDERGVVVISYPTNGLQNGSPDGLALVDAAGHVVEFLSYEGTLTALDGPAAGMLSTDIQAQEASSSPVGQSLQRDAFNHWQLATASLGACNGAGGPPPPPPGNTISFAGRVPSDPPLPVGFQAQIFATVRDANNVVIPTSITWTSDTPAVASIDSDGVMSALSEGTAILRATAADGVTTAVYSLPTRIGVASTTAVYAGNAEFGEPTDSDPSDDFIVRHVEYTASYNPNRGTPNWVSYDLEVTHFGDLDRCNCFTFDPDLPSSFTHYTTADYTGAAAINGFGIDRGHLARSFDRTSASLDNAFTFYFTNIVPQASDLNQGPWAILESDLGDLARFQNKEVYITAGVAGSKGTVKNEGKIVIPASTWKVAVIMPRDHGLANVVDYRDLQVIAVNMPNDPGVRNVPWQTYQTTVTAIEVLTGYDLLALLPDKIESIVEAGIQPPIGTVDGPYVSTEGGSVIMSAAGSVDPNGAVVSYDWSFGDGTSGTGAVVTHSYAQDGVYTVRLIVADNDGLTDTIFTTTSVANVAPVVGGIAGATLQVGETYTAGGAFTDPGADAWSCTVNWGDGSADTLALGDRTFSLSHAYTTAGTFTVTVSISDDDVTSSTSQVVTVISPAPTVQGAINLVSELLASGKLGRVTAALLNLQLSLAQAELDRGHTFVAVGLLRSVVNQVDVLVRVRALSATDGAELRALLVQIIQSISN